jgi:hypothetical protein
MLDLQYPAAGLGCHWDAALLEPVTELNVEVLEALAAAAARAAPAGVAPALQWQWRALGEAARLRLARTPFLLVDAGFARPECWCSPPRAAVHEAVAAPVLLAQRGVLATPLLRRVLVFAWHLARANRPCARIALGMSAACAGAVASWRFADLEALAERRPAWIRPRWQDRPEVWQAWLDAALQGSSQDLARLRLWAAQSLAAEVTAARA